MASAARRPGSPNASRHLQSGPMPEALRLAFERQQEAKAEEVEELEPAAGEELEGEAR